MLIWFNKIFGWRNWAVLNYNSFIENIFVVFYIALRKPDFSDTFILDILIFFLFSVFSTTYGYLINDYSDIELDQRQGKENTFQDMTQLKALGSVIFILSLSILSGLYFSGHFWFSMLWLFWLAISSFYSLPPVRLKEKGAIGLIFVILAQRALPILLVFTALGFEYINEIIVLSVFVFFRGASSDINHQLDDITKDAETGTNTFAVIVGKRRVEQLLNISLEIEKALLALILVGFTCQLFNVTILGNIIIVLLLIFYWVMYVYSIILQLRSGNKISKNPFRAGQKSVFQFLHHSFPTVILALGLCLAVCFLNWKFIILLVLIAAVHKLFSSHVLISNFLGRLIKS